MCTWWERVEELSYTSIKVICYAIHFQLKELSYNLCSLSKTYETVENGVAISLEKK